MGKPIWTLKQMKQLLEICIDLRKWYRFEKTKFRWVINCKLCKARFIKCEIHFGRQACPNCPWVVFEGSICYKWAGEGLKKSLGYGGTVVVARWKRNNEEWNNLRIRQLTRWIRLLKQRIKYQEDKNNDKK